LVVGLSEQTQTHSVTLTDLKPGKSYSYVVKSRDQEGNLVQSQLSSFATQPLGVGFAGEPLVSKVQQVEITASSAKITWKTKVPTTSWIDYGLDTSYGNTAGEDVLNSDHVVELKNLIAGALYHYRVRGKDASGNEYVSGDFTFRALVAPTISEVKITDIKYNSATVMWKTNTKCDSIVEFGLTAAYGQSKGDPNLTQDHKVVLDNLEQNTVYNLRVTSTDEFGNKAVSSNFVFKTPQDLFGPVISNIKTEILKSTDAAGNEIVTAIVSWNTDEPSTAQIEYGLGVGLATYEKVTPEDPALSLSHTAILSDLEPQMTYHFRIIGRDKYGNLSKSNDLTLLTPPRSLSILQRILKVLEETFAWTRNLKDYVVSRWNKLFSR